MSVKILKYAAIKAIIDAEEEQNDKLALKRTQAIHRALRRQNKMRDKYFEISDNDTKYFKHILSSTATMK